MNNSSPSDKPTILAIETSGNCGSVSLVSRGNCIAEISLNSTLTHSRRILVVIEQLLADSRIHWDEIDAIAVSLGPGSFTGLRIGLSTAKGLIMATGKPLIGVPTLDGLACQVAVSNMLICPVIDARKKEVYTALYRSDNLGGVTIIGDVMTVPPEEIAEKINEPVVLLGDGTTLYKSLFIEKLGDHAQFIPDEIYFPRAAAIGAIAIGKWDRDEFLDPESATPLYFRASEAEILFGK
ncbi:tRNA (adenosine(37)-N6)-threonylcarbamoyltransferase complex dimerization subunit type 1 TsaB [Thermodesulfobacteriota bacterium]